MPVSIPPVKPLPAIPSYTPQQFAADVKKVFTVPTPAPLPSYTPQQFAADMTKPIGSTPSGQPGVTGLGLVQGFSGVGMHGGINRGPVRNAPKVAPRSTSSVPVVPPKASKGGGGEVSVILPKGGLSNPVSVRDPVGMQPPREKMVPVSDFETLRAVNYERPIPMRRQEEFRYRTPRTIENEELRIRRRQFRPRSGEYVGRAGYSRSFSLSDYMRDKRRSVYKGITTAPQRVGYYRSFRGEIPKRMFKNRPTISKPRGSVTNKGHIAEEQGDDAFDLFGSGGGVGSGRRREYEGIDNYYGNAPNRYADVPGVTYRDLRNRRYEGVGGGRNPFRFLTDEHAAFPYRSGLKKILKGGAVMLGGVGAGIGVGLAGVKSNKHKVIHEEDDVIVPGLSGSKRWQPFGNLPVGSIVPPSTFGSKRSGVVTSQFFNVPHNSYITANELVDDELLGGLSHEEAPDKLKLPDWYVSTL